MWRFRLLGDGKHLKIRYDILLLLLQRKKNYSTDTSTCTGTEQAYVYYQCSQ